MNHLPKPQSCRSIGLQCDDCAASTALQLAVVCANSLDRTQLQRMFHSMYPDEACQDAIERFMEVYRAAEAGKSRKAGIGQLTLPLVELRVNP